jgi:hypothetical protein
MFLVEHGVLLSQLVYCMLVHTSAIIFFTECYRVDKAEQTPIVETKAATSHLLITLPAPFAARASCYYVLP